MYVENLSQSATIYILSAFSLAWLIVGVLAGQRLPRPERRVRRRRAAAPKASRDGTVELYAGNLSYDIKDRDLHKEFSRFGKVLSARIIINKFNGKSKGYGFVEIAGESESAAAVKALNGKDLKGRRLVVNAAKSHARD